MVISENALLENLNTFRTRARAKFLVDVKDVSDIDAFIASPLNRDHPKLILGGGSNILFSRDFEGCILRPLISGVQKLAEDDETVRIRAGAGENWDELVSFCVGNGYGGIENLSWIPGSVGAAPVQNIGAYGMELRSVVDSVEAIRLNDGKCMRYSNRQCKFSYRNSLFKSELKNQVVITHVTLVLRKKPDFVLGYGELEKEVSRQPDITLQGIRTSVIAIRQRKLPDHESLANAGSFFKNPETGTDTLKSLRNRYHDMPSYESGKGSFKIPAAWLIEQCGWKGKREGNVGTYERQPLVIVNYGSASGSEILAFAEKIRQAVYQKFGITLESEVNII